MKNKKKNQLFKVIFIFLFIAYITIFTAQKSGYMDFQNYKKMSLTKEKIIEFQTRDSTGIKAFINLLPFYGNEISLINHTSNKE